MHKRIVQNFLDIVILLELRKRPLNSPDVINFVQNKFHITLSSDTVNSSLHALENERLITAMGAQNSKAYTLTERGKEAAWAFSNSKDRILGLVLNLFVGE